jgi:hypothetical protein
MSVNKHIIDFKTKGERNVTSALGKVTAGVKKLAGAYVLYQAGTKSVEWAKMAGDMQGVERAFINLQDEPNKLLNSMKKATSGMISDMELMQKANQASLLGLDTSRFDDMLKIARASSQATGESMDFMLNSIVTGLGRGSKMILDNLGIQLDVNKANEKYAKILNKSASALTEEERKQALINETMEIGLKNVERSGGIIEQQGDAFQRFGASLKNLGTEIGEKILPAVSEVTDALAGAFDFTGKIDWTKSFKNIGNNMSILGQAVVDTFRVSLGGIPELFSFTWKKAVELIPPIIVGAFTKLFNWISRFSSYVFEPIVIGGKIAWEMLKSDLAVLSANMQNTFAKAINFIKKQYNSIATSLGFEPLKLSELIDTDGITAKYDETIADLQKQGMKTDLMKDIFGSDTIEDVEDFADKMDEIWSNALNNMALTSEEGGKKIKKPLKKVFSSGEGGDDSDSGGMEKLTEEWGKGLEKIGGQVSKWGGAVGDVYSNLYDFKKQKLDEDMESELKAVQQSSLSEETKNAKINNIKEKFRQKDLQNRKSLKPAKYAEAVSNIALGVSKALSSAPPPFNIALAGITASAGAIELATIANSPYEDGGFIGGKRHSQGGTIIEAEQGEYIINRKAVEKLGLPLMEAVNSGDDKLIKNSIINKFEAGGIVGGSSIPAPISNITNISNIARQEEPVKQNNYHISIEGNVMTEEFAVEQIAPAIEIAVREGKI